MGLENIKSIGFVNGTKPGFDYDDLEKDVLYFVRTSSDKENGLVYFNGKKYGNVNLINAGEYPDNTI